MQTSILVSFALLAIVSANWQNDALKQHNQYRKRHGSPTLKLDKTLNRSAQKCANRIANVRALVHTKKNKYGENLSYFWSTSRISNLKATRDAITTFYNENKYYNYKNYKKPKKGKAIGHFTQVVWRASRKMGIAIARNGKSVYICAQYSPPGNYFGQKNYNKNVRRG